MIDKKQAEIIALAHITALPAPERLALQTTAPSKPVNHAERKRASVRIPSGQA
jgi:hypothetical protein